MSITESYIPNLLSFFDYYICKQPYKDMADEDKRRYENEANINKPTSYVSEAEEDVEVVEEKGVERLRK